MAIYKDLLREKSFLQVAARARALVKGSNLKAIKYKEHELFFQTASGTRDHLIHSQVISLEDLTADELLKVKSFNDIKNLMLKSKIKVWCSCEAFQYWGFSYIAYKKGYGIKKELRRPRIRNPREQGFVCKHLYLVLQLLPFLAPTITKNFMKYKEHLEDEQKKLEQKKQANTNTNINTTPQTSQNKSEDDILKDLIEGDSE